MPGGGPGGESFVGVVLELRSRTMRLLHEHRGEDFIARLEIRATNIKGEAFPREISGGEGQGGNGMGNV